MKKIDLVIEEIFANVSRDGSNLLYMKKAAINYGLNVDVYKVEPEEIEKQGTFPCILHWGFCQFAKKRMKGTSIAVTIVVMSGLKTIMDDI